MKVLAELLEDEKKDIEGIFERLNSLNSLTRTLSSQDPSIDEKNWLYEKLINDTINTKNKFNKWWTNACKKYELDRNKTHQYYVDFSKSKIILDESFEN